MKTPIHGVDFKTAMATALAMVLVTLMTLSPVRAATLSGVNMPDQKTVNGKTLVLNGLGMRTATFLKVKVYVIGLYLESKSSDDKAIISKQLSEIDCYDGEHAIEGIRFLQARTSLGVNAWGMNLLELAPDCANHPTHDHRADGQEEVYAILRGSAWLKTPEGERDMPEMSFTRVGPAVQRQIVAGAEGALVLAIGGVPREAYIPHLG